MKHVRPALPVLAAALLAAAGARPQEGPLYVEEDGIVVIELESHPPVSGWARETEHSGFTGSCYLTANGGSTMTFPIFITRPGRYRMRIHNRHDHPRRDLENDAFVRMDSGQFIKCFSGPNNVWTWTSTLEYSGDHKVPPDYDLSAGLHKLQIRGRSSGFKIDRVALFLLEPDLEKKATVLTLAETRGAPAAPPLDKVPSAAKAWAAGQLGTAFKHLKTAAGGKDEEASRQAASAIETFNAYVARRKAAFEQTKTIDPLAASEGLAFFASNILRGSDAGKEFASEARKWKTEPAAKLEARARGVLKMIETHSSKIRGTGSASDAAFAKRYARPLAAIRQGLAVLRKSYAETWCRKRAEAIAAEYGLDKS